MNRKRKILILSSAITILLYSASGIAGQKTTGTLNIPSATGIALKLVDLHGTKNNHISCNGKTTSPGQFCSLAKKQKITWKMNLKFGYSMIHVDVYAKQGTRYVSCGGPTLQLGYKQHGTPNPPPTDAPDFYYTSHHENINHTWVCLGKKVTFTQSKAKNYSKTNPVKVASVVTVKVNKAQ